MTDPNFRALCAELSSVVYEYCVLHEGLDHLQPLVTRANTALATPPPEPGKVAAWMYQGEDSFDGMRWRENWEITIDEKLARFKSGNKEPIPLFNAHDSTPPPEPPTDEELLRKYGVAKRDFCYEGPIDDWPKRAERAATIYGLRAVLERWG
jgi:hypothetical protein